MKRLTSWSRRVLTAAILTSSALAVAAPAANAECLRAELWYEIDVISDSREYVLGPQACVLSTPWPVRQSATRTVGPAGLQVGVGVWIPSPVFGVPIDCCPE